MRSGIRCAAALLKDEAEEPRDHAEHASTGKHDGQSNQRIAPRKSRSGIAQSSAVAICDGCMDDCDGRREEAARGALER
jgi:hypothetical protein